MRLPLDPRVGVGGAVCRWGLFGLMCAVSAGLWAADVAINEVHYHPPGGGRAGEFVELHNPGEEEVDLGGWFLAGGVFFEFPPGTRLAGKGYLVVAADASSLMVRHGLRADAVAGSFNGTLDNAGEALFLVSPEGRVASAIEFGDAHPWPERADGLGASLERLSPGREDTDPEAWRASALVDGTPAARNSVQVDDPRLPPSGGDPAETALIPSGAEWRFFRGRSEPDPDWLERSFDDGSWESGPAGIGYGDGDDATVLADMRGSYSTVYARRAFMLKDPEKVLALELDITFDDGYVAYLNGTEVSRFNVPGPQGSRPPFDALATISVPDGTRREIDLTAVRNLLVAGENVLAVQGLNARLGSSDFSLHPTLDGVLEDVATREETLIASGSTWRFLRGLEAPPGAWRELAFDDAVWESGEAGFGYGDGDDATFLDDMQGRYVTVFIRTRFEVTGTATLASLTLGVDYDDGFVAYLNGVEVARANVGDTAFDRPATGGREAGSPEMFPVPVDLLVEGTNVLAVQGHNFAIDSSDFSLAPHLIAERQGEEPDPDDPPPPAPLAPAPRDLAINEIAHGGAGDGWVEIHNPGAQPVDAGGRHLVAFVPERREAVFSPGTVVPAGGFLVISEDELGFETELSEALVLATADGRIVDALNPRAAPPGRSSGRFPDGSENRYVLSQASPGAPNAVELETAIAISEIMYNPHPDNPAGEYLELFNRSEEPADLGGWAFTRGVSYTFAEGTTLGPGEYLVLAADPAAVEAHYGVQGVLGPYSGALRGDAETVLLRDALGNPADQVRYADEGSWPEDADGLGPSVELVHPDLENRYGPAWRASDGEGTPGSRNSARLDDPPPVVAGVEHSPLIPSAADTVRVLAAISDDSGIQSATLFWERDAGGGATPVSMADDGLADDGVPENGVWGGEIPPQQDGAVIAFWIRATAVDGAAVTVPAGAPDRACLYQVEDAPEMLERPLYRLIMRRDELQELRTRNTSSNVLLDVTVVAAGRAYYNRGIRNRGNNARRCDPLSYRVQFDHDVDLHGIKRLNLNGCNIHRQWVGLDFLRATGIPTPDAWFRRIAFNGSIDRGVFLRVEAIDAEFLERNLPGDDSGNLYRGVSRANLDYRGEDFDPYRPNYVKRTNERDDDYSDVADLCFRFDDETTSGEDFPAAIEERVDVEQWALYFAAYALLGSTENSILLNSGDDYFLYHRPGDDRWILLPWDLDSVFNEADQVLFRPTVPAIVRFLRHPRYAPSYWCHLQLLLDHFFTPDAVESSLQHLAPLFPGATIDSLRGYVAARRSYIEARLARGLDVLSIEGGELCGDAVIPHAASLSLTGQVQACGTTRLLVNGTPVDFDVRTSSWTATIDGADLDAIEIVALDRDGGEVARRELASRSDLLNALPSVIDSGLTLDRAGGPYHVPGATRVSAGVELAIEPGVRLLFAEGAALLVEGSLAAEGTGADPVVFAGDGCGSAWGGVAFLPGSSGSRLIHCELAGAATVEGYGAPVAVVGADVLFEELRLATGEAVGILVGDGGAAEVRGGRITAQDVAVRFDGGGGRIAGCELVDAAEVAVSASGASGLSIVVEDCRIEGGSTGIATGGPSLEVRRSTLRGLSAAGIAALGATITVEGCLLMDCGTAIALSGGAAAELRHLTVTDCPVGLRLAESEPGAGGAQAAADSLIIWGSETAADLDAPSALDISFSDTAGGVLPGPGNISADPVFADAAVGDFRLRYRSPCRGTGKDGTNMGAFPALPVETNEFLLCDSNGDGRNNLSDAIFNLEFLFLGGPESACRAAMDCDSDGELALTDAVFNLTFQFLGGTRPREPYPECDALPVEECGETSCLE